MPPPPCHTHLVSSLSLHPSQEHPLERKGGGEGDEGGREVGRKRTKEGGTVMGREGEVK